MHGTGSSWIIWCPHTWNTGATGPEIKYYLWGLTAGILLVFLKESILTFVAKKKKKSQNKSKFFRGKQQIINNKTTLSLTSARSGFWGLPAGTTRLSPTAADRLCPAGEGGRKEGRKETEVRLRKTPSCVLHPTTCRRYSPVPTRPPCSSWWPPPWWGPRSAAARPGSWRAAGAAAWSPGGSGSGLQTPDGSPGRSRSQTDPRLGKGRRGKLGKIHKTIHSKVCWRINWSIKMIRLLRLS